MNLEIELSDKQTDAIRYLQDKITTEVVFGGGAGGGKSVLGTWWLLKGCINYPGTRWVMGRAVKKTLKETTLKTFFEVLKMVGLTRNYYNFNQVDGVIRFHNESEILLKDLFAYPSDPDFDELGSLEITGAFIDEASQITIKAKNILKSRIRYKLDENGLIPKLLMTTNPCRNFLYANFYKPFTENTLKPGRAFVHALLGDNPFITPHYKANLLGLDKESKERLLFGNWQYLDDPTKLIEYDKILDLWSNDHVEEGKAYISCDVARYGGDKTVAMVWDGLRIVLIKTLAKSSIPEVVAMVKELKTEYEVPMSQIIVDDGGVGGGVVDLLPGCKGFVANKKPVAVGARQNFANLKSQCYFMLADYVNGSKIWMQPERDKDTIIEELEQVKKDREETDDKLRVVKKDDVKEMLGRSPDYSDTMMMRMWFEIAVKDYFA